MANLTLGGCSFSLSISLQSMKQTNPFTWACHSLIVAALWDNAFQIVDQLRGNTNAQIFNRQWCLFKWKLSLVKMVIAWSTESQYHHTQTIYFTHHKELLFQKLISNSQLYHFWSVSGTAYQFTSSQPLSEEVIWLKRNGKTTAICPLWKIPPAQYQCWFHDYEPPEQTRFMLQPALEKLKGWRCSCSILLVREPQITLRKGSFILKCSMGW